MNFEYQMQKSDERYFLNERHKKTNAIYFILFALFFLGLNIPMMKRQFWVFFVIYIFYVLLLSMVLWLCNYIFTLVEIKIRNNNRNESYIKSNFSVTKRGITQTIENKKIEVLWKNIKKVKIRRNYIFIEPKNNGIAFLFQRKTLNDKYEKLIEIIKQYMNVKK